jgi:hypothetical protein
VVRVELMYFIGCPAYRRARERTLRVLKSMGMARELTMTRVRSDREATRLGFRGSPTLRVNGVDIDPDSGADQPAPGLYSREYTWNGRREDVPPEDLLRRALAAAWPRRIG